MSAPEQYPAMSAAQRTRSVANIVGIVLMVLFAIAGLAFVAYIICLYVALASFGSNK